MSMWYTQQDHVCMTLVYQHTLTHYHACKCVIGPCYESVVSIIFLEYVLLLDTLRGLG